VADSAVGPAPVLRPDYVPRPVKARKAVHNSYRLCENSGP
jgi:hypothetical protein